MGGRTGAPSESSAGTSRWLDRRDSMSTASGASARCFGTSSVRRSGCRSGRVGAAPPSKTCACCRRSSPQNETDPIVRVGLSAQPARMQQFPLHAAVNRQRPQGRNRGTSGEPPVNRLRLPKLNVAGSNPVARSNSLRARGFCRVLGATDIVRAGLIRRGCQATGAEAAVRRTIDPQRLSKAHATAASRLRQRLIPVPRCSVFAQATAAPSRLPR